MDDRSLEEKVLGAVLDVFTEHFGNTGEADGLQCVDAMSTVLAAIIDAAPDKHTKDTYAVYASSLIVTHLQAYARERGEDDSLPDQIDAKRMQNAERLVRDIREQAGMSIPDGEIIH